MLTGTGLAHDLTGKDLKKNARSQNAQAATASDLRQWSIFKEGLGRVEGPRDTSDCAIRPMSAEQLRSLNSNSFQYYALQRPGEKNLVAIAKIEPDCSLSLNPRGFNYGPIPVPEKITSMQADSLWGLEGTLYCQTGRKTYKLIGQGDVSDQEFFLDVDFENNKLRRYRIRKGFTSDLIPWKQVVEMGGSSSDPPKTEPSS